MPTPHHRQQQDEGERALREDDPIPAASEDRVLEETARLAREGRKELESDPRESRPAQ